MTVLAGTLLPDQSEMAVTVLVMSAAGLLKETVETVQMEIVESDLVKVAVVGQVVGIAVVG